MKFKTISKAALMAVLLSTTAPVFGASVDPVDPAAAAVPADGIRAVRQDGLILPVDILPGDQRPKLDQMLELHRKFTLLNADNIASDAPEIVTALQGLASSFHQRSIQNMTLEILACNVKTMHVEIGRFGPEDTLENRVRDLSRHFEVAGRLFRFTSPGGLVIPPRFPSDDEYFSLVISLFEHGATLRGYAVAAQQIVALGVVQG